VTDLATRVVKWQKAFGRNDLPWQGSRDPYRVWLSEIMLQQTQVKTVLAYFPRFLERFPNVNSLAAAPLDDVLGLWSGLGYYSRARKLHQCAMQVVDLHGGIFPGTSKVLQTLPGIGRSTAGAIASLCFSERVAILDGNVRRVLTRVLGFGADLSIAAHQEQLWDQATRLLPVREVHQAMPPYTQGMMDLGATVCTARKPACDVCPLAKACVAKQMGQPDRFPVKQRKLKRSAQSLWLLWARTEDGAIRLSKRPVPGVWAGLYCFPLFDSREALQAAASDSQPVAWHDLAPFTHVLTHKDLHLHPVQIQVRRSDVMASPGTWIDANAWQHLGLPAPVRELLTGQQWMADRPVPGAASG
jgi:A/G-specific adenine glycosylase